MSNFFYWDENEDMALIEIMEEESGEWRAYDVTQTLPRMRQEVAASKKECAAKVAASIEPQILKIEETGLSWEDMFIEADNLSDSEWEDSAIASPAIAGSQVDPTRSEVTALMNVGQLHEDVVDMLTDTQFAEKWEVDYDVTGEIGIKFGKAAAIIQFFTLSSEEEG